MRDAVGGLSLSVEITHENGRFHFKYTKHLLVVIGTVFLIAGVAGLQGPWWQSILVALLNKADLHVDDRTNYAVSGILTVTGLAILLCKYFVLDRWDRQIASDKATLAGQLQDPASPQPYLKNLVDDHSYWSSQDTAFHHVYTVFRQAQHGFQYDKTIKLYDAFSTQAQALHGFVAENFFVYPNNQPNTSDYRYAMAPHLNQDRDMTTYDPEKVRQYDELKTELHRRVKDVETSYSAFLRHVRRIGAL